MQKHNPHQIKGGFRGVLKIAIPLIISGSALTVMQFCDRMFLGRYDSLALKAVLPAGMLSFTLSSFFFAVGGYASALVAQYYGAGEDDRCIRSAAQGAWWVFITAPVFLVFPSLAAFVLRQMNYGDPELVAQMRLYINWMFAAAVPTGLSWVLSGYFTGRSRVILNTVLNIIACVTNIILNYVLIFGNWGSPRMGLEGAAIATFVSSCIAPSTFFAFILADKTVRKIGCLKAFAFDWRIFRTLVRFGVPAGVQIFFDVGAFSAFTLLAAKATGTEAVASTAAFSINNLAFSPLLGISTAAAILCGQFKGADDYNESKRAGWAALRVGWCYMALIAVVFTLVPETLLSRFIPEDDALFDMETYMRTGRKLIVILTVWGFFDAANIIVMGALKGVGDTKFTMLYMTLMGWLLWIPLTFVFFNKFGYGIDGIVINWIWMAAYIALLAAGFVWRWHRGKWFDIKVID